MALSEHVPLMTPGATGRNILVGVLYFFLFPLVLWLLPFYFLWAVGTNRNGLAEALADSPLGVIPPVSNGGWQAAVTMFLLTMVMLGMVVAATPPPDDPDDRTDSDAITPTVTPTTSLEDAGAADSPSPTAAITVTATRAATQTATQSPTAIPSSPPKQPPTATPSPTYVPTPTPTPTSTLTPTATPSPTSTATPPPSPTPTADEDTSQEGELEIHHIDVGQADATLIITPAGETVLIDTGDWRDDGSTVISYLQNQGIERIDYLVATHGHADHIGGHAAVIEHFEEYRDGIGAAYDSGVTHDTQTYEDYLDAVDEYDVDLLVVEEGDEFPLEDDGVKAEILNPIPEDDRPSSQADDLHYNSVTIMFEFGSVQYLTTGDADGDAESRMSSEHSFGLEADIYQAGHHGSSASSTDLFLSDVDPTISVISSDYDSQYGHPHDEVLDRFADYDIETYWTGVHEDVVITTDGDDIEITPAEDFSTNPEDIKEEKPDDEEQSMAVVVPSLPTGLTSPVL